MEILRGNGLTRGFKLLKLLTPHGGLSITSCGSDGWGGVVVVGEGVFLYFKQMQHQE